MAIVNPTVPVFHFKLYLDLGVIGGSFHRPEFDQSTGNNSGSGAGAVFHGKFLVPELSDQDGPGKTAGFIGSQDANFLILILQIFSDISGVGSGILEGLKKNLGRRNMLGLNLYLFSGFKFQIEFQTVRFGLDGKGDQHPDKKNNQGFFQWGNLYYIGGLTTI
jgi:hypothetical protein